MVSFGSRVSIDVLLSRRFFVRLLVPADVHWQTRGPSGLLALELATQEAEIGSLLPGRGYQRYLW